MEFLMIASAHFLALLSPGPDFFLILRTSLRLELRYACAVCGGIATANGVYILLALLGLESVRGMEPVLLVLRLMGSAYLIYLGIMLLRAPQRPLEADSQSGIVNHRGLARHFSVGFLSAILNPKNMIFYLSLFTVMVDAATPLRVRLFYGCWMVGVVLCWDLAVASTLGSSQVRRYLDRWIYTVEKGAGLALTVFGLLLALE